MKRFILTLLLTFALATPVHAATFYRVILDLPFESLTTAINFMNLIETNKDKVFTGTTLEGLTANAKMVGSWVLFHHYLCYRFHRRYFAAYL